MRKVCVGLLLVAGALSAQALNLTALDALAAKARESVNVTLDANMLRIITQLAPQNDKSAAQAMAVLSGLKSISVRQFEFKGRGAYQEQDLAPVRSQLTGAMGWARIISQKDGDEINEIFTRTDQGRVVGLTIIAAESNELTVVSIDGLIDLVALAQMGGAFGIPDISSFLPDQIKGKQEKQDRKGKEE